MTTSTALTYPGRKAALPAPALIGRVGDRWPAAGGLDPMVALVRSRAAEAPEKLFEVMHQERFRALQAQAPNTQKAYASDWRVFVRFCHAAGFGALPASPSALEAFIEWSLPYSSEVPYKFVLPESPRRNVKVSTVERAIAAIGAVHRWLEYADPAAHKDVAHTLAINARGRSAETPKAPVPYAVLERGVARYDDSLKGLRAKALVTLQWTTMLRRSELVALTVEDLEFSPEEADGLVRVRKAKADQAGAGSYRYVSGQARTHLQAWLAAARITGGPIFRGLNRHGELRVPSKPQEPVKALHANEVARIWKDLVARAGYDKREVARIAGHSPRIGAAQELSGANFATGLIAKDGGWGTDKMVLLYNRGQDARKGAMAQFFRARTASMS